MKTNKQKVLIIGGGFGGVKTALDLSKDRRIETVLISEHDHLRYYPSLYHTATGGSREVSTMPLNDLLDPKLIDVIQAKVTTLDRAQKVVKTSDGTEYSYDYLVLAMGVVTNFFHIPGLEELAFGIKSLEDAEELKKHLHKQILDDKKPDINYVVVGGGPSGIELVGVLGDYVNYISKKHIMKKRPIHVDLIEAAPRLVPRMPKDISRKIEKKLRSKGVKLYLNAQVEGQTAESLTVNGKPIRSHTVVWTAGVANNPFFKENGFQLSQTGKVRVDQYLQAEPSIFVIGDNADTPYSGMAQTAVYDGVYLARSLSGIINHKKPPTPYKAKKPIYVMPAGPDWAAVLMGNIRLYGLIGWSLRRAADFIAYKDYEPFFKATKRWISEYEHEDLCEYCDPASELTPVHSSKIPKGASTQ